jgi:hypothetical protein
VRDKANDRPGNLRTGQPRSLRQHPLRLFPSQIAARPSHKKVEFAARDMAIMDGTPIRYHDGDFHGSHRRWRSSATNGVLSGKTQPLVGGGGRAGLGPYPRLDRVIGSKL